MNDFTRKETHLDRDRLAAVLTPVVRAHGGEVVDFEWKQEPGGWVLRVFVEKAGSAEKLTKSVDAAVSLELCAAVARDLSPALDVADLVPHRYNLEVSSPGVERPLKDARDYARFAGEKAKLRMDVPIDGQKVVVGVLEPLAPPQPGCIGLREGSRLRVIPLADVHSARLVFEFGPAPRPKGGRAKAKGAAAVAATAAAKKSKSRGPRKADGESTEDSAGETSNS